MEERHYRSAAIAGRWGPPAPRRVPISSAMPAFTPLFMAGAGPTA